MNPLKRWKRIVGFVLWIVALGLVVWYILES